MNRGTRSIGSVTKAFDYVGRIGLIALMLLVVVNVFTRYVFRSIPGAYDYVQLMTLVAVSAAVAFCAFERGHIEVSVLVDRLPARAQAIIGSAVALFSIVLLGLATWQAVLAGNASKALEEKSMTIYIPIFPFYWFLAFALGLTTLATIPLLGEYLGKVFKDRNGDVQ